MDGSGDLVFPGYALVRELGSGGSGTVVVAREATTGTLVAIKLLAPGLAGDAGFRESFREEARILASLRHPNIAAFLWYHEGDTSPAIAMELVDGVQLRRLIARGPATPEAALSVLRGSLLALDHVHRAGLVHRDYKPGNVIVDRAGQSKLVDFGIAVRAGEPGELAGTPAYAAPEQWAGQPASPRTDVYAATGVLVECLRGTPPFGAGDSRTLRDHHLHAPVPLDGVPAALHQLVAHGLAKDPAQRYPGAAVFLEELERAAVAGYGRDWLQRGSVALAGGVVSMAALLPLGHAAAGMAGATPGAGSAMAAAPGAQTSAATQAGQAAQAAQSAPAAGPGHLPAAGRAARAGSRVGSASGAGSAVLGAVLGGALLLGTLGVTHRGPFAGSGGTAAAAALGTALRSDFGTLRAGNTPITALPGSAALDASAPLVAASDGHVVQTILISAPASFPLGFAFCDGQVCGNSDNAECVVNLEIPNFGGAEPLSLQVSPPPGSRLQKLLTVAGSGPGALTDVGYFDPSSTSTWNPNTLSGPPTTAADGSLQLAFNSPIAADVAAHFRGGRLCGFTTAEATAFTAKHGRTLANTSTAVVRLVLDWSPPTGPVAGASQMISLNSSGAKQTLTAPVQAAPSAAKAPPVQRQDDARWSSSTASDTQFGVTGSVPTTVSTLLAAFGFALDPPTVGKELIASGAWKPGTGTDWRTLIAYISAKKLTAGEVDLISALDTLERGGQVLAATTRSGSGREATLLVTGYDATTDTFGVIDPLLGAVNLAWDDLLAGNPWFIGVTLPAPAP